MWGDWPPLDYEFVEKYYKPLSSETLVKLLDREYKLVKGYLLSRPVDEILRWDGTYNIMMKTMDSPDAETTSKVLLVLVAKLGHVLFGAFAEEEDAKSWHKINLLLAKRTMRIDPTGELAKRVVHVYSDTCCGDSPKDPTKHWLAKIYPNVKRAPGKDPVHGIKMVTESTMAQHPLYSSFCKRTSSLLRLRNKRQSENDAVAAFLKHEDSSSLTRKLARQAMLQKRTYTKCIYNGSAPTAETVSGSQRMYTDFLKKDEELHAAAKLEHGGDHHYKVFYTPQVPGKQRSTKSRTLFGMWKMGAMLIPFPLSRWLYLRGRSSQRKVTVLCHSTACVVPTVLSPLTGPSSYLQLTAPGCRPRLYT
jgi:hypothetical protein